MRGFWPTGYLTWILGNMLWRILWKAPIQSFDEMAIMGGRYWGRNLSFSNLTGSSFFFSLFTCNFQNSLFVLQQVAYLIALVDTLTDPNVTCFHFSLCERKTFHVPTFLLKFVASRLYDGRIRAFRDLQLQLIDELNVVCCCGTSSCVCPWTTYGLSIDRFSNNFTDLAYD